MRILGITAEYNPFHNGHRYHLERSMEMTGADFSVAVMSGSFTQRGEYALLDKWTRAALAVSSGVDLVLELPFLYACSRAQIFAEGAVDILKGIGATHISFGSETGDMEKLRDLVQRLGQHGDEIVRAREQQMKKGDSFARANHAAVEQILGEDSAALITDPNNILAVEYLKRTAYWNSRGADIKTCTVKRFGSGYREKNEQAGFAGASAIRSMASCNDSIESIGRFVPEDVMEEIRSGPDRKEADERMLDILRALILRETPEGLSRIYCMGEGIGNRFIREIRRAEDMDSLTAAMVSKRYTASAVRRMMVYLLMGICEYEPVRKPYCRILAAGKNGRRLLKTVKKQEICTLPVITNINKEKDLCAEVRETLRYDLLASDLYNTICGRDLYRFSDKVVRPYI